MQQVNKKTAFVNLTEANFRAAVLESDLPVIVSFGASWLATCDIMAPILEELNDQFGGQIKFCLLDADDNEKLVNEYSITHLPTFIFFQKGRAVDHIIGAVPKHIIANKLGGLLLARS